MMTIDERAASALQEAYSKIITEQPDPPVCPLCCGMGAVGFSVPLGHPAFGRAFRCPCQDNWTHTNDLERSQRNLEALFGKDGIPKRIAHITFDTFKTLPEDEQQQRLPAITVCKKLVQDGFIRLSNGTQKYGVVLSGLTGRGKSGLSVATSRAIAARGNTVLWKDFNDLIDDIQATYSRDYKGPSKGQLIDAAGAVKVLVLDDVGSMKEHDNLSYDERKILYAILRQRHANNRVTILTTNQDRKRFKQEVDPRTYRRVRDLCVWIDMGGNDLTPYGQEV